MFMGVKQAVKNRIDPELANCRIQMEWEKI